MYRYLLFRQINYSVWRKQIARNNTRMSLLSEGRYGNVWNKYGVQIRKSESRLECHLNMSLVLQDSQLNQTLLWKILLQVFLQQLMLLFKNYINSIRPNHFFRIVQLGKKTISLSIHHGAIAPIANPSETSQSRTVETIKQLEWMLPLLRTTNLHQQVHFYYNYKLLKIGHQINVEYLLLSLIDRRLIFILQQTL